MCDLFGVVVYFGWGGCCRLVLVLCLVVALGVVVFGCCSCLCLFCA